MPLNQKGVDTGMGLERLLVAVQKKESVFETDLFEPIIKEIEKKASKSYNSDLKSYRIISDHIKSAVFLISEGIFPSNVERGYVLRRILRRAIRYGKLLNLPQNFLIILAQKVIGIYGNIYPGLKIKENDILVAIQNEEEKFEKTLDIGIKSTASIVTDPEFNGEKAYNWYATSGVPFDIIKEIAEEEKRIKLGKSFELDFEKARKKHQEISRAGVEKKFGGVGKDAGLIQAKLHTATHLLHAALREILGKEVRQMGSDITPQRLRFDFSFSRKLTPEEIKKVEDLVNQKIKEDLEVKKEEMSYEGAIKSGALAFFKEKYPEKVLVYSISNPSIRSGQFFSKEICAGPHIRRTSELGKFEIVKEESSGAGIRRIRAILE
jgi:alanyl-tRNA synthetase